MSDTNKPALPEPAGYFYEVDSYFGIHRQFNTAPYNGMRPNRTIGYYTADQLRTAIAAERAPYVPQPQRDLMPVHNPAQPATAVAILDQQYPEVRDAAPRADEPATLKLGDINERLAPLQISAAERR